MTAVALGTFDGLHLGHMDVIASTLSMKGSGLLPCVLLFDRHPQAVLSNAPAEILQGKKREEMLLAMGLCIEKIEFASVCRMTPETFFEEILLKKLGAGALCCGKNYRFGAKGAGDVALLQRLCEQHNILLHVSECLAFGGEPISSTRIRAAVAAGDMRRANLMLGRAFSYRYEVVHGDARGRLMGAPTVNQYFEEGFAVPAVGVYAAEVFVGDKQYPGVANIGVRPTFGGTKLRSETHIIGFDGDIYGEQVEVALLDYIRGEKKFDSMDALAKQIQADRTFALKVYAEKGEKGYV